MATWQDAVGNRPAQAARRQSPLVGIVAAIAGALLVVGTLLPWVKGTLTINVFILGPQSISHTVVGTGVRNGNLVLASGFVILGAGLLMLLFHRSRAMRIGMGVLAVAAVGVIVSVFLGLLSQKHQVDALRTALQKISNGGGPLGQLLNALKDQLNPKVHVSAGPGIFLVGVGILGAAVGGLAAIVTGLLRRSEGAATAAAPAGYVPPAGYATPAGYGPQPGYVPPVAPSPAWPSPAPAPAPAPSPAAAWPPRPLAPPGPPPAQPGPPGPPPAPTPPPMPARGSHAPTVIDRGPAPTPNRPTVVEQPSPDPNELPPPRRGGAAGSPDRPDRGSET